MTWTLIPMPAAEELAGGYVPSPHQNKPSEPVFTPRRFLTIMFAIMGLAIGFQHGADGSDEAGHRRIAEISIGERKGQCRDCAAEFVPDLPQL